MRDITDAPMINHLSVWWNHLPEKWQLPMACPLGLIVIVTLPYYLAVILVNRFRFPAAEEQPK
jgi:hypothetical protein